MWVPAGEVRQGAARMRGSRTQSSEDPVAPPSWEPSIAVPPPSRTQRPVVGVIGPAACDGQTAEVARAVGRAVAERGAVLLTGGRSGVMEAACRGARDAGGLTVGILPGANAAESPPNPY